MNQIIPFNYESHEVRVIKDENGNPWWVAKDVCTVLEISKYRDAITKLDEDERCPVKVDTLRGLQEMTAISEPGLYTLILRSNKPEAKRFKRWITHEVIPSIRTTGSYSAPNAGKKKNYHHLSELAKNARALTSFFRANLTIVKMTGYKGQDAITAANEIVKNETGKDCVRMVNTALMNSKMESDSAPASKPQNTDDGKYMPASALGGLLGGLTGKKVYKILELNGLIENYKDRSGKTMMKVTQKGQPYAVLDGTGRKKRNGKLDQKYLWMESVLDVLNIKDMMNA